MKLAILLRKTENQYYVNSSYISFFTSLGYSISYIHILSSLKEYDAFVLPGGYDVDPKFYNEENKLSQNIDCENDLFDFKVIAYALITNKKVFGICRGIQSINVFFKGKLYQDIRFHQKNNHFIQFENKYLLSNSFHHQAIKKLGYDLNVISCSIDHHIEGIIHKNKKIIGVQFHPEIMNCPIIQNYILNFFSEV